QLRIERPPVALERSLGCACEPLIERLNQRCAIPNVRSDAVRVARVQPLVDVNEIALHLVCSEPFFWIGKELVMPLSPLRKAVAFLSLERDSSPLLFLLPSEDLFARSVGSECLFEHTQKSG